MKYNPEHPRPIFYAFFRGCTALWYFGHCYWWDLPHRAYDLKEPLWLRGLWHLSRFADRFVKS